MTPAKSQSSNLCLAVPGQLPFLVVQDPPALQLNGSFADPPSPLTPGLANSQWAAQEYFLAANQSRSSGLKRTYSHSGRVSISGIRTPSGFEHLDFGADYFGQQSSQQNKRLPRDFEWDVWAQEDTYSYSESSEAQLVPGRVLKRRLGPNETSYYLGSRGDGPQDPLAGVNDMYLHLSFKAPPSLMSPSTVLDIWTELRLRHTLLGSVVEFDDYEDIRFAYVPPPTLEEARQQAETAFGFHYNMTKNEMLDKYLNGPRMLSDDKLAAFHITTEQAEVSVENMTLQDGRSEQDQEYNVWLFATHFIGDGMALHSMANEFFTLLQGGFDEAKKANALQWQPSGEVPCPSLSRLPPALEERLSTPASMGRMAWAAARVEFQRDQGKLIGGHTFPRAKKGTRHTVVPTAAFSQEETSTIIKTCKANGSTISHAIFALANMSYIKVTEAASCRDADPWCKRIDKKLPMMLYSALNLRPNMAHPPEALGKQDYFHLCIGYYNVVLPTFKPSELSLEQTFWLRAKQTKEQTVRAVKSPWLAQRSKLMFLERERRSIGFEKQDEARRSAKPNQLQGLGIGAAPTPSPQPSSDAATTKSVAVQPSKVPSVAFLGVSMLGNLDALYQHAKFPSIKINGLTTGSRQRPGAMLLFAYTLCGRLYLSLGYDKNAYAEGSVEKFWDALFEGVKEFLLPA